MNRHRLARSVALGLALSALVASSASARPIDMSSQAGTSSLAGTTSATPHSQFLGSPDARDRNEGRGTTSAAPHAQFLGSPDARDRNEGRGTLSAPEVTVVKVTAPAPPNGGIDWGDAGIGAGGMLGLILLALGTTLVVVHRRRSAPHGQPAAAA